jgi:hypothetical protein
MAIAELDYMQTAEDLESTVPANGRMEESAETDRAHTAAVMDTDKGL